MNRRVQILEVFVGFTDEVTQKVANFLKEHKGYTIVSQAIASSGHLWRDTKMMVVSLSVVFEEFQMV